MSPRSLAAAYVSLLGLTALTVFVAFQDLGGLNLPLALAIAAVKGSLVALSFMHLRNESPTVRLWAAAGVLWLLILIVLTMADFGTRETDVHRGPSSVEGR